MPKIAVVEDDVGTNESHCEMLRKVPNAEIHSAYNLAEAEVLISAGGFDLLVIDIDLGGGSEGRTAGLRLLAQYGGQTTTIIVSGAPEENLREISLTLKAYDFISKPVHEMDFENKVKHALDFNGSAAGNIMPRETIWPTGLLLDKDRPPNLLWRDKAVSLTLTELTIVHCLAIHPGELVTYEKLAAAMKSGDSMSAHMTGVRKKFKEKDLRFDRIVAVPSKGYRWKADDE